MIGIGTRWSDFTTASKTAFRNEDVRFVNVNVASFDAAQARRHRARRRRARHARAAGRAPRRLGGRRRLPRRGGTAQPGVGRRGRASLRARPRAAAGAERGDRRRQRRVRADGRARLRRGRHAGRPPQAVAHARPEGLPRRVRLLVHGLRDRRRPRRQAGRTGAGRLRARRRRLLPDALQRDRDLDPGGPEADDRARGQPRLQLDRLALTVARHRRLRDALPLSPERQAPRRQRRVGRLPPRRPRGERRSRSAPW